MTHKTNIHFLTICQEILKENKSEEEWAEIESDDMFQEGNYEGGFDATGMDFCFSVFENEEEFWFQFPLNKVQSFIENVETEIEIVKADY
jgi:hypothetical protein